MQVPLVAKPAGCLLSLQPVLLLLTGPGAVYLQVPWMMKEACRLLGELATWLAKAPSLPFEAAAAGASDMVPVLQVGSYSVCFRWVPTLAQGVLH
jgi:hypothetical protein